MAAVVKFVMWGPRSSGTPDCVLPALLLAAQLYHNLVQPSLGSTQSMMTQQCLPPSACVRCVGGAGHTEGRRAGALQRSLFGA